MVPEIIRPARVPRRLAKPSLRFRPTEALLDASEVLLCIPEDQRMHLPPHTRVPEKMPYGVAIPRRHDVVYLTSSSAWVVSCVVHELLEGGRTVQVQVWLEHLGVSRYHRQKPFDSTH
jgi:hypothetical protein